MKSGEIFFKMFYFIKKIFDVFNPIIRLRNFYVGSKNGSARASPKSKKSENLGTWIIVQSGSIGEVPGGPWVLKSIKKSVF